MDKKIQLVHSGIPLVDQAWGGLYRGGTYILVGKHKAGKTLLSLQFALECARQNEVCLYFTSMRPKDLMIQAASIDFDLQNYMNQNLIIVVRVAPPSDLFEVDNPDEFLDEYLNDIITVVNQYQPNKIVFDELTYFVGFNNLNTLQSSFSKTNEAIEESGITSLFVLADPATPATEQIVESLKELVTGVIYLKKNDEKSNKNNEIIITPNIGHTEGIFKANYNIEPYKGVTVEYTGKTSERYKEKTKEESKEINHKGISKKYKSLAEIEVPDETSLSSNYYSINDFKLILNNQIALFNSTGQVFTVLSFHLNLEAEKRGLLTLNQLQSAVRLSTEKKDKICVMINKVVVLLIKEDQKSVYSLIGKIKANLLVATEKELDEMIKYISVCVIKVSENTHNADDIFEELLTGKTSERNRVTFQ